MTRLVRKVTPFAVCGMLVAGAATAGIPDPSNFECVNVGATSLGLNCPKAIFVVGDDGTGHADPIGEFCVIARDFNNLPIPNAPIVIDFSNCDVQLCAQQDIPGPDVNDGVITDCVLKTVTKLTDANGVACFWVKGKTKRSADPCATTKNCVEVWWEGTFICGLDAPTFDLVSQSGEDGLNPNDLSEWLLYAFTCPEGPFRGNYDCTNQGTLDPNDLSVWLRVSFAARSALTCAGPTGKCAE